MFELDTAGNAVRLSGELDIKVLEGLRDRLDEFARSDRRWVLDLGGVTRLDMAALQVVLAFQKISGRDRFRPLNDASEVVRRVLELTGLDQRLAPRGSSHGKKHTDR